MGGWAMSNIKEGYLQVEKDFAQLKDKEYDKMVESLETTYRGMGKVLSGRYLAAENDPAKMEELKQLAKELDVKLSEASKVFKQCGLEASDTSKIFDYIEKPLGLIRNFKLELRSVSGPGDNKYNALLLQMLSKNSDIGLSSKAVEACNRARSSRLPCYHEAHGYAKAAGVASVTAIAIPFLISGTLLLGRVFFGPSSFLCNGRYSARFHER